MNTDAPTRVYLAESGHLTASVGSEVVLLHKNSARYYGLNAVASRVWGLLQESISTSDLVRAITKEFETDPERARRDIEQLLEDLVQEGFARRVF